MEIEQLYDLFLESEGISTDTRKLDANTLFFALKGDNFNGNEFAQQALKAGCSYAIIDEAKFATSDKCILVENVLKTLQKLANYHRKQFDIPFIGITGSNGKTTTKELIGAVLSKKYNVLVTQGNLNNHLGVPFTLLRLSDQHEIAVIEMGANKPGDIKELVEIADPTHGIITNIGAAHIEGFGSLEGVIKTKTELYNYIEENGGTIFFNADDKVLVSNLPVNNERYSYAEASADVVGTLVRMDPFVTFSWKANEYISGEVHTHLVGKYNFINFLAAIAIGNYFHVEPADINLALSEYIPSNNRSQISKTDRNTLIVDCYNANATSMRAALESFVDIQHPAKLAILGDMLELGAISQSEHAKIVNYLKENNIKAMLVGNEFKKLASGLKVYSNTQELIDKENLDQLSDQLILLKGSRGIKLENLIPLL